MNSDSTSTETRHLTDEKLASYVDGTVSAAELPELESHLAACADCRREVVEIGRLAAPVTPSRSYRRVAIWLAPVAAAVAAVIFIGPALFPDRGAPTLRTSGETPTTVEVLEPGGAVVSGETVRFGWRDVAGAVSYRVTLLDESGITVWTAETSGTSIALPSSVEITTGTEYHWHVDALLARGGSVTSGMRSLVIQR